MKWSFGIVLVFGVLTAPPARGQCEQAKLTASDAAERDVFGTSVDISGDYLVVGAPTTASSPDRPGAAYVFQRNNFDWVEVQKLTASDAAPIDAFGQSVTISEDVIAVGAWRAPEDGIIPGAVYVFRRADETWVEEAKIIPSDIGDGDQFGLPVSIDGNYLAIGAKRHDLPVTNAGAVYVYWFDGVSWVQQDKLTASDATSNTLLGGRASLSGNVAVARSFFENATYVFRREGVSWSQEAKLIPSGLAPEDEIAAVGVRGDEIIVGYIQVSKPFASVTADETSGTAYVFRYFAGSWVEAGQLIPGVATPYARFGHSLDFGESNLVICARDDAQFTGAAYFFKRIGMLWTAQQKITATDGAENNGFGDSCAIDGTHVVVGASGDDDACPKELVCASGSAYVYWLKSSPACEDIPTVTMWGFMSLLLLLVCTATIRIRRNWPPSWIQPAICL
jgi:hypothetical protein